MARETGRGVQQHMGAAEGLFHWVMILCTLGFWYPVYKRRKNQLARTVKYYGPGQ